MNEELVQYIREHRATYTRETLTAQLVAAGHSAADVEAAWTQLVTEDVSAARTGTTGWITPAEQPYGRGAGAYLAMALVGIAYFGSVAWFAQVFFHLEQSRFNVVAILYTAAMIASALFLIRRMFRALTSSTVAVAFLIAIVLYFGLAGACIVGVLNAGFLGPPGP